MADLPNLTLIDVDVTKKEAAYIAQFEAVAGRTVGTADPVRLLLATMATIMSAHEQVINDQYAQVFITTARTDSLDYHGADVLTTRLEAAAAITTLQFTLSGELIFDVIVPAGTRATAGDDYIFATDKELTISAGDVTGIVTATCATAGEFANNLVAGQINKMVDIVGYVASVTNTTASNSGTDEETDDNYRERIRIALESFSVAGPEGAYIYRAKSAHQSIADVGVEMTSPGTVTLYPLLEGGELPTTEILDLVSDACSAADVRPLTDNVIVATPTRVSYDISFKYYIAASNASLQATIAADVQTAVNNFVTWQAEKLGRNVNDSELISRVIAAGASRVAITSPSFMTITSNQQAVASSIMINYDGTEHD